MKVLVLYYSQTGNTQKIARSIAAGVRTCGHQADVKFMTRDKNENTRGNPQKAYASLYEILDDYDMVGIGSPVWYEMPPNVRSFVENMPERNGQLGFSFCTHATMPNLYFPLVIGRLQRGGFRIVDWAKWYGNSEIQIFPEPYYTAGHPDETDMSEAKTFGMQLCEEAQKILAGDESLIKEAPAPDMMRMHANAAIDHLGGYHNVHGKLVRDPEKCLYPKCHICMDNCTMGYIQLEKNPQKFGSNGDNCDDCHGCTYCELLCPVGAIHPEIAYEEAAPVGKDHGSDLFCRVLNAAEAQGTFRRLIPEDEVGTKSPYYSVHSKHPRRKQLSFKEDI